MPFLRAIYYEAPLIWGLILLQLPRVDCQISLLESLTFPGTGPLLWNIMSDSPGHTAKAQLNTGIPVAPTSVHCVFPEWSLPLNKNA